MNNLEQQIQTLEDWHTFYADIEPTSKWHQTMLNTALNFYELKLEGLYQNKELPDGLTVSSNKPTSYNNLIDGLVRLKDSPETYWFFR